MAIVVKVLAGLVLAAGIAWMVVRPGWELGIAIVWALTAFVALFVVERRRVSVPPQRQQVSGQGVGIQAGGDVIIHGYTLQDHERLLKEREAQVRQDLHALYGIQLKLSETERTLKEKELAEIQIENAIAALQAGHTDKAAYEWGKIKQDQLDYRGAYAYFQRAVGLVPVFDLCRRSGGHAGRAELGDCVAGKGGSVVVEIGRSWRIEAGDCAQQPGPGVEGQRGGTTKRSGTTIRRWL